MRYRQAGGEGDFPTGAASGAEPLAFSVSANAPNPFSGTTAFTYVLPEAAAVTVRVFNVLGQEVGRPVEAAQAAGRHGATFDASPLAPGVYLYRVEAESGGRVRAETRRMLVVR